jgi:hypothetical protein
MVVFNTYCVVFFFFLCALCYQFLWIVHFLFAPSQGLLWLPKSRSQKNRQVPFSGASFESQEPV